MEEKLVRVFVELRNLLLNANTSALIIDADEQEPAVGIQEGGNRLQSCFLYVFLLATFLEI